MSPAVESSQVQLGIPSILDQGVLHPRQTRRNIMLSKCANPECPTEFKYFRHGRFFEFNIGAGMRYNSLPPQSGGTRELFWLCHDCSRKLTLQCANGQIVPISRSAKEHRAA